MNSKLNFKSLVASVIKNDTPANPFGSLEFRKKKGKVNFGAMAAHFENKPVSALASSKLNYK